MKNESKHTQLNETKWNSWAETLDEVNWRTNYLRNSQQGLISILDVKENMRFLDIGCGTGWALGQIAQLINGKSLFYGIDLSPKMIAKAQENFKGRNNFHFSIANAESIPLDSGFDIIICTNSFHHYLHPDKALQEMHRLLKTGGKAYILDPTADWCLIKLADKLIKIFEPAHVKLYSSQEFQKLIAASGLKYIGTQVIRKHQKVHIGKK